MIFLTCCIALVAPLRQKPLSRGSTKKSRSQRPTLNEPRSGRRRRTKSKSLIASAFELAQGSEGATDTKDREQSMILGRPSNNIQQSAILHESNSSQISREVTSSNHSFPKAYEGRQLKPDPLPKAESISIHDFRDQTLSSPTSHEATQKGKEPLSPSRTPSHNGNIFGYN